MQIKKTLFSVVLSLQLITAVGQEDDLFSLMDIPETTEFTYATFKGTRIINSQSNETPGHRQPLVANIASTHVDDQRDERDPERGEYQ